MGNTDQNKGGQEPDLNQILKNKREKLANLQAAGKDRRAVRQAQA